MAAGKADGRHCSIVSQTAAGSGRFEPDSSRRTV